jgi:hypothetical protein
MAVGLLLGHESVPAKARDPHTVGSVTQSALSIQVRFTIFSSME